MCFANGFTAQTPTLFQTFLMVTTTSQRVHLIGIDNTNECSNLDYQSSTLILLSHGASTLSWMKSSWQYHTSQAKACLLATQIFLWTIASWFTMTESKTKTMASRIPIATSPLTGYTCMDQVSQIGLLLGSPKVLETFSCRRSKFLPKFLLQDICKCLKELHLTSSLSKYNPQAKLPLT